MIETSNLLTHPSGPAYAFTVSEGTFTLKDDLALAAPPPHPSELLTAGIALNPLATTKLQPRSGTRVTPVVLSSRKSVLVAQPTSSDLLNEEASSTASDDAVNGRGSDLSNEARDTLYPITSVTSNATIGQQPVFGEATVEPPGKKRRKPKTNIIKSNSSFVSRTVVHDQLGRRHNERGDDDILAIVNIRRSFHWLNLSSNNKQEPWTKVLFTKAHPICHAINELSKRETHIDIAIGFSTGDIIWYEPFSNKYSRLNKNGIINGFVVNEIKWIPGSENLMLAAHGDGSFVVYDKEKDDAPYVPDEDVDLSTPPTPPSDQAWMKCYKSVNSKNQKTNPVAWWKLGQPVNSFAFSPDGSLIAAVCEDGTLRIIDHMQERLIDIYRSYFGALLCVCWSPDGRFVVAGGQDDLVTIWSVQEKRILARCQGHQGWVKAMAFDPWKCEGLNYRFGTVGDDCRLLLWDFNPAMILRPRSKRPRSASSASATESRVTHTVEGRAETALLPPSMSKVIDDHPLAGLEFQAHCIITSCSEGHIRTWSRPVSTLPTVADSP